MKKDWREKAVAQLDLMQRHAVPIPTKDTFAKKLGISRVTLWREKRILGRLEEIIAGSTGGRTRVAREGLEMRVRRLEAENIALQRENDNLVQNVVVIYTALRDEGLDPIKYLGELAADVQIARRKVIAVE
jgi:hypothetical protein